MLSKIIKKEGNKIIIQTELVLDNNSMLHSEELIQKAVNNMGNLLTEEALSKFDTDGSPINVGGVKMTSKGVKKKNLPNPLWSNTFRSPYIPEFERWSDLLSIGSISTDI